MIEAKKGFASISLRSGDITESCKASAKVISIMTSNRNIKHYSTCSDRAGKGPELTLANTAG
jgi:hypothetical protein